MTSVIALFGGLPGAGKSLAAAVFCDAYVEADDYFVGADGVYRYDRAKAREAHTYCFNMTVTLLESGVQRVGVANTFTETWERQPYLDLGIRLQIPVFSFVVENRHGGQSAHGVAPDVIETMRNRFQVVL